MARQVLSCHYSCLLYTSKPIEHWKIIAFYLIIYDIVAINFSYFFGLLLRFDLAYSSIPENYLSAFLRFAPFYTAFSLIVFYVAHMLSLIHILQDTCASLLITSDCLDTTGLFTWTDIVRDSIIRTGGFTFATLDTFVLINIRFSIFHGNRTLWTGLHTWMSDTCLLYTSGKFKTYREMPWGEVYLRQFDGRCIKRLAFSYGNRIKDFQAIMEHMHCVPVKHGDIAYQLEIFPDYLVQMIPVSYTHLDVYKRQAGS